MAAPAAAGAARGAALGTSDGREAVNQVHLVGRVAAPAASRTLPSGDTVTVLRVVVDRPPPSRRSPPRAPTTDTLDCAIWTARLRQRAAALVPGAIVEVDGALRRRFWRSGSGPVSRYEVEVAALRRVSTGPKAVAGSG
jgi:single-strand DNA-binding protein